MKEFVIFFVFVTLISCHKEDKTFAILDKPQKVETTLTKDTIKPTNIFYSNKNKSLPEIPEPH